MELRMFSGIIERLGIVSLAKHEDGALALRLETGFGDLTLGESVATNGVCLTVTTFDGKGSAHFFASAETLSRTNLGTLREGMKVNLERSVSLDTRLSGHMVQGHVDGKAVLKSVEAHAGAWKLLVHVPKDVSRYCVEKGSITLNGISLTINTLDDVDDGAVIGLTIIPHTWEHTNLHAAQVSDVMNVEVDVMAKYVERLCLPYLKR
jgi:riboflavin synthase